MDTLVKRMGILLPILLLIAACNSGKQTAEVQNFKIVPANVTFPTIGAKVKVHLFRYSEEVTGFTLTSANPAIVAANGNTLIAKSEGKTTITLTYKNFRGTIKAEVIPGLKLQAIYLSPEKISISSWDTYSFSLTGVSSEGDYFYNLAASYQTGNELIATVDSSGTVIIGTENGSTSVTASCCGCKARGEISVNLPVSPPYAGRVISYSIGVSGGYGEKYLPNNVLGPPRGGEVAQSSAKQLLSLGNGGWIILEFADYVTDGPGVDFIVFENPLVSGNSVFTETAFVDVSQDGTHFIRFPAKYNPNGKGGTGNPDNYKNLAGVHPVYANPPTTSATDPEVAGGDQFDLSDVGLKWIRFVRIVDTGYNSKDTEGVIIDDAGNHFPCGPDKCGFDLDAVSIVHSGHQVPPGR